jgi:hypothetical protein
MLVRRPTRQQVKRRRGQRVLVGAPIDVGTHQLFRRGVADSAHGHVGGGQTANIVEAARYPKVGQQDSPRTKFGVGEQNVSRLDIAMQHAPVVGVVESVGDRGNNVQHFTPRHSVRIAVLQQLARVGYLQVVEGHQ